MKDIVESNTDIKGHRALIKDIKWSTGMGEETDVGFTPTLLLYF